MIIEHLFTRRILSCFLLGICSGLPLLLVGSTMQAWMVESGISLAEVGLVALVGLPYNIKFLWSPIIDRFNVSFLGRRRGWLVIFQICVAISLFVLSLINPAHSTLFFMIIAMVISFFSASQDIVIDAYRREILAEEELGLGTSYYIGGYRIGLLLAGAVALPIAERISWPTTYMLMALLALITVIFTLLSPKEVDDSTSSAPASLKEAVVGPFKEFFTRDGAWFILAFILLYKVGDAIAANMTMPFYLKMNYTKIEIGSVVKFFGFFATLAGAFLGGVLLLKFDYRKCLWGFGILQAISTACFVILYYFEHSIANLSFVIAFENLASGMGTAAFAGYMASVTNRHYTATQLSLLTSLMAVPRTVLASPAGLMVEAMNWDVFFFFCALIALPGMILINIVTKKS